MGLIGTIATFGVGYAAGAATGDKVMQRLPERFNTAQTGNGSDSAGSTVDLREVRDVMTAAPEAVRQNDSLQQAAGLMKEHHIGDVLVEDETGMLIGIVTDRDIVVRAVAEGRNPQLTPVGDVFTRDVTAVAPTDTVQDAMHMMRTHDIRRLPVVEGGRAIGIVSLADISSAAPDR